jgi:hypothetical protein
MARAGFVMYFRTYRTALLFVTGRINALPNEFHASFFHSRQLSSHLLKGPTLSVEFLADLIESKA